MQASSPKDAMLARIASVTSSDAGYAWSFAWNVDEDDKRFVAAAGLGGDALIGFWLGEKDKQAAGASASAVAVPAAAAGGMDGAAAVSPAEMRSFMQSTTSALNNLTNNTHHMGAMLAGLYRFRPATHKDEALKLFSTGRKRTGSDQTGSGSGSEGSSPQKWIRAPNFRSDSLDYYALKHADGTVMCQVTGCYWPAPFVSTGHSAPNQTGGMSEEYLRIDPDNPRNSLNWIEPIETAAGSGRICVVMLDSKLVLKVMDETLLDTKLVEYGSWESGKPEAGYTEAVNLAIKERLRDREACLQRPQAEAASACSSQGGERSEEDSACSAVQPASAASSSERGERSKQPLTFRDLHYRPLCFNNEKRPYMRALSTAALRAHKVQQAPIMDECNYWMHSPSLPNSTKIKVAEWLYTAGMKEQAQQVSFSME